VADETGYPPLPTDKEAAAARECARVLSANLLEGAETQQLEIVDGKGVSERLDMPASALTVFAEILRKTGEGNVVKIVPKPAELSMREAASRFNVWHDELREAFDNGELPFYQVGARRRILYKDMVEFSERRWAKIEKFREEELKRALQSSPDSTD